MPTSKKPWLSKTILTNLVLAAAAFLPAAQDYLSAHPLALSEAFAVVNIILRVVSKDAISLGD